jgi:ferredoxin
VEVVFLASGASTMAKPGEVFVDVAERAGVSIELGCNQGNCASQPQRA